ncbi:hypothetical protein HII31_07238 [Pseudocercospora fuligena]|uniref:Uncharacterized protein n=1 Tax=Pseudocercospora fuligena TaxID=685502 RepID=A0A8H6VH17_9PEZI|nr:hypothetical protein HII31_07238 [Pseudocercospora fuligena]
MRKHKPPVREQGSSALASDLLTTLHFLTSYGEYIFRQILTAFEQVCLHYSVLTSPRLPSLPSTRHAATQRSVLFTYFGQQLIMGLPKSAIFLLSRPAIGLPEQWTCESSLTSHFVSPGKCTVTLSQIKRRLKACLAAKLRYKYLAAVL